MNSKDKKAEVLEMLSQTNDSGLIDEVYEVLHPEGAVENINMQNSRRITAKNQQGS